MIHKPPCSKGCADRNQDCHSTCEKYLDWLKVHAQDKNTYVRREIQVLPELRREDGAEVNQ